MNKEKRQGAPAARKPAKPAATKPPGQGTSRSARRRKARRAQGAASFPSSSSTDPVIKSIARDTTLSAAARAYVRLIADPVGQALVGMPVSPVLETQVDRVFTKGVFNTSTAVGGNNIGFVVASPAAAATNPNGCVEFSNAAAATAIITTNATNVQQSSNSTWANLSIGQAPNVQFRTVAAVLRIRNITPTLTRGGRGYGIMEASHSNLGGTTFAQMGGYVESGSIEVASRNWINILYRPVLAGDYDFKTAAVNINAGNDGGFMAFMIEAPVGNPQTFEFEFYSINEYLGQPVRHRVLSPSDPVGAEATHTVLVAAQKMRKPHEHDEALPDKAEAAVAHVVRHHSSNATGHPKSEAHNIAEDVGKIVDTGSKVISGVGTAANVIGSLLSFL